MKRFVRNSVAAMAVTATLATATVGAPAFAQDSTSASTTEAPESKETVLDGLTAMSTDDTGLISASKIRELLQLIETIVRTLTSLTNFAGTLGR